MITGEAVGEAVAVGVGDGVIVGAGVVVVVGVGVGVGAGLELLEYVEYAYAPNTAAAIIMTANIMAINLVSIHSSRYYHLVIST